MCMCVRVYVWEGRRDEKMRIFHSLTNSLVSLTLTQKAVSNIRKHIVEMVDDAERPRAEEIEITEVLIASGRENLCSDVCTSWGEEEGERKCMRKQGKRDNN